MRTRIASFMLLAMAAALPPVMGADDMFVGTWKLNVEKSKFSPGPAPKSSTVTIEPGGKVSIDSVNAEGQESKWGYTAVPGAEATIEGMENATVIEKRVGDRTVEHTWNMGGPAKMTGRGVLSKNGKTLTYTLKGANAKGETVHNVEIYEKQ
jgi:hypothetical protein